MVQFLAPCRLPAASTSGLEPSILAASRFLLPCHELAISWPRARFFVATKSEFVATRFAFKNRHLAKFRPKWPRFSLFLYMGPTHTPPLFSVYSFEISSI